MFAVRLHILIVLAMAISGCGVQFGKYQGSGGYFDLLSPDFGILAIDRGSPWGSSEPEHNLLYIVMLCPGVKVHPPLGSSQSTGRFTSSQYCWWSTDSGQLTFSYSWNRVFDSVRVVGFTFDRASGNAFIARRSADGLWSVKQLSNVSEALDSSEALNQIKQQMAQDRYIAALSLPYR
jgi:hypothetical protein